MPRLLTLRAAAEYLGVKPASLYRWATLGEISSIRPHRGGRYFFEAADLDAWIAEHRQPAFKAPDLLAEGFARLNARAALPTELELPAVRRFS